MGTFFTLKRSFTVFFLGNLLLSIVLIAAMQLLKVSEQKILQAGDVRYQSFMVAEALAKNTAQLTQMVRSYVTTQKPEYETRYNDIVAVTTGQKPRADGRTIALEEFMREQGFSPQELGQLQQAQGHMGVVIQIEEEAMKAVKGIFKDTSGKYTRTGDPDIEYARKLVNDTQYEAAIALMQQPIDAFYTLLDQRTTQTVDQAVQMSRTLYLGVIGVVVALFIFTVVVLLMLYRMIKQQVELSLFAAERLAKGDLSINLSTKRTDELGRLTQAIQGIAHGLTTVVHDVRSGIETMDVASREISAGNANLSSRTEAQASSLEETATSMEELTTTVKQNAENARQANVLVTSAADLAKQGGEVVANVVATMSSIKDSSAKIVDIISVIDGIAFQTNILALNAAVEAARAGEQGRGFAVVASEVRTLAQRSANAAKEIKTLIDDSVSKVEAGGKLVDEAGETMSKVVTSVNNVTQIMGEITAASEEQSAGIEEINQAITQMDEITQQNAALVEQAAAAAESLQDQTSALVTTVSIFKLRQDTHTKKKVVHPDSNNVISDSKKDTTQKAPREEHQKVFQKAHQPVHQEPVLTAPEKPRKKDVPVVAAVPEKPAKAAIKMVPRNVPVQRPETKEPTIGKVPATEIKTSPVVIKSGVQSSSDDGWEQF
jgi:methyl-accepting chemotaxis protein